MGLFVPERSLSGSTYCTSTLRNASSKRSHGFQMLLIGGTAFSFHLLGFTWVLNIQISKISKLKEKTKQKLVSAGPRNKSWLLSWQ